MTIKEVLAALQNNQINKERAYKLIHELKIWNIIEGKNLYDHIFLYNEDNLKDHMGEQVFTSSDSAQILLGITQVSLSIDYLHKLYGESGFCIQNLVLKKPIIVEKEQSIHVFMGKKDNQSISVFTEDKDRNVMESAEWNFANSNTHQQGYINIAEIEENSDKTLGFVAYDFRETKRGDSLKAVKDIYKDKNKTFAKLSLSEKQLKECDYPYLLQPALIDSAFAVALLNIRQEKTAFTDGFWVPFMFQRINYFSKPDKNMFVETVVTKQSQSSLVFDLIFYDESGKECISIEGFTCKKILDEAKVEQSSLEMEDGNNPLKEEIIKYCKGKIASVFKQQKIDSKKNFMDQGMDSIQLVQLADYMSEDLKIDLYPTIFFEYPNILTFCNYLYDSYYETISAFFNTSKKERIQVTKNSVDINDESDAEDIAIIGMTGIFADSSNLDEFWKHIINGDDLVTEVPEKRFKNMDWFDEDITKPNKSYCKSGSFITVDEFDPYYFGITPKEAKWLDPQLRVLLENVQNTIDDAGYGKAIYGSNTGVYIGNCFHEYWENIIEDKDEIIDYQASSSIISSLAGRISYTYNLKGSSMPVDTACASSLTALHLACQAMKNKEIDMAIVGGINLILSKMHYIHASKAQALSKKGRCFTFDAAADGYVPGEGAVSLLLKPLSKAKKDKDKIYAVIKGSAVNHVGHGNNPTSPSIQSQTELLLKAWEQANIEPETIGYIEAHGTGTILGDPIEINALKNAYAKNTIEKEFCGLGSAKAYIGHLEGAAGLAGIVKTVLGLRNKIIPKMPSYREVNPYINLEDSPFYIPRDNTVWRGLHGCKRRAGVSSFGLTGSNAHVVLEEYDEDVIPMKSEIKNYILTISAKTKKQLEEYIDKYLKYFIQNKDTMDLEAVTFTSNIGRMDMEYRWAYIGNSVDEFIDNMNEFLKGLGGQCIYNEEYMDNDFENTIILSPSADVNEIKDALVKWSEGHSIDWNQYYQKPIQKVSLPLYPFSKEKYWKNTSDDKEKEDNDKEESYTFYQPIWKSTQELSMIMGSDRGESSKELNILLFDMDTDLYRELSTYCNNIKLVLPGNLYNEISKNEYRIDPANEKHYEQIIKMYQDKNTLVIHAWSNSIHSDFEKQLKYGFFSMVNMIKAMANCHINEYKTIYLYESNENDSCAIYEAMEGFFKTVRQEFPKSKHKVIGIDQQISCEEKAKICLYEISSKDFTVKYNEGKRYVQSYEECEVQTKKVKIRGNGTYLLTGGLGGLGIIFAKYLASVTNVNLILTGRSLLTDENKKEIEKIKEMGSNVEYLQCDLSEESEVKNRVDLIMNQYGTIHGVLHLAGINRDMYTIKKSYDDISEVIAPKVYGTSNLLKHLSNIDLDFISLFSSLSAIYGNEGQCDYAFANRFMDLLAIESKNKFSNCKSINWPLWTSGGMQINNDSRLSYFREKGLEPMTTMAGIKAWSEVVEQTGSNIIIVNGDDKALSKETLELENYSEFNATNARQKVCSNKHELDLRRVEEFLLDILSGITELESDKLDCSTNFNVIGIDSIIVNSFNHELDKYMKDCSHTLLYEFKNIKEIASYLYKEYQEELTKVLGLSMNQEKVLESPKEIQNEKTEETECGDEVAIIGISGRFPQADDLDEFWDNLKEGKDSITEIPKERWDYTEYYSESKEQDNNGKMYCKWGGFLKDIDKFDPLFFNLSPREIETIDPQERIFLETAWHAMEDAGYTREELARRQEEDGNVGVYAGVTTYGYALFGPEVVEQGQSNIPTANPWSIANRVSYICDFHGPSMPIDTACSSSLAAIHMACQGIKNNECGVAIAGGVNLYLHPSKYIAMCQMKMLSPTGRCHAFGEDGDGFVPGEGVGALVLKPLSKAIKDGDHIYGVVKGSSMNHGGTTSGYTVPNPTLQTDLIVNSIKKAKVDPNIIGYVEAHGTGTSLGDPIEIKGLTNAFRNYTDKKQYCAIGSVKSNIGHLESASGIAGIMKILLQFKYKTLVPTIHCMKTNPNINFQTTPFYLQRELSDWKPIVMNGEEQTRTAAISSFGAGGVNVNIILQDYSDVQQIAQNHKNTENSSHKKNIILLSARKKEKLAVMAQELKNAVKKIQQEWNEQEDTLLQEIAYTLQVGREMQQERVGFIVKTLDEFYQLLDTIISGNDTSEIYYGNSKLLEKTAEKELPISDEECLKRWINGEKIAWEMRYDKKHHRISLPGYPFSKTRYWYDSYQEGKQTLHRKSVKSMVNMKSLKEELFVLMEQASNRYHGDKVKLSFVDETIAILQLNDVDNYNMFTDEMLDGMMAKVWEVKQNKKIKVLILTGTERVFCMGGTSDQLKKLSHMDQKFSDAPFLYLGLLMLDIPVITAMQGHASGGGMVFGLYGDIIMMAEEGVYSAVFMKYGFTPGIGATYIIKEKLGANVANEMMFTAKSFTGEELKKRGVSVIFERKEEVLNKAIAIARQFSNKSREALMLLKEELSGRIIEQLIPIIEHEQTMHDKTIGSEEVLEKIDYYYRDNNSKIEGQKNKVILENKEMEKTTSKNPVISTHNKNHLISVIKKVSAHILHILVDDISDELTFKEMGVDSITGVEIIRDLNKEFNLCMETIVIYDYPNIESLADYIATCFDINETDEYSEKEYAVSFESTDITNTSPIDQNYVTDKDKMNKVKEAICKIASIILHIPLSELDGNMSFKELGIDSISGVELIRDMNKEFGTNLETVEIYDYSCIDDMAQYIASLCQETDSNKEESQKCVEELEELVIHNEVITASDMIELTMPDMVTLINEDDKEKEKEKEKEKPDELNDTDAVAVIGIAGRFPGADSVEDFWENIQSGVDSIVEGPTDRWNIYDYYEENSTDPKKTNCKWCGVLNDADSFDALFFNISPREAELIDPQQRVFLEEAWHALEDAGYSSKDLNNINCGVYVGAAKGDYEWNLKISGRSLDTQYLVGTYASFISARIAYLLNLHGPNYVIDTACSSSLAAIHEACQSILRGESDMALAGGVSVLSTPIFHLSAGKSDMLSKDGRCKTFDNSADGMVPGEGVAVVVLKSLKKAQEDKDHIYGVIRGTGINYDGKTNGMTAPSSQSQTRLELEVFDRFHINPDEVSYVEAHGTGTKLGDPIEVKALTNAFRNYTQRKQYCAIGSVKTNIGHTLTASGVIGLVKVLLCMQNEELIPSLHYHEENENINFLDSPFYVNTELRKWEPINNRRIALINSFGLSGTNGHVVVEDYCADKDSLPSQDSAYIIPISAKNNEALKRYLKSIQQYLIKHPEVKFGDLGYTLQNGRNHYQYRCAIVATSKEELITKIDEKLELTYKKVTATTNDDANTLLQELNGKTGQEYVEILYQIAQLYEHGHEVQWNNMYTKGSYRRISLPGYPFSRNKYWISADLYPSQTVKAIHPLVDSNESDFEKQCYKKTFTLKDFVVKDHCVKGTNIVPGAALMEMACAAGKHALPQHNIAGCKNVVFKKPVIVHAVNEVFIELVKSDDDTVRFEIYAQANGKKEIYTQGELLTDNIHQKIGMELEAHYKQNAENIISRKECYEKFKQVGMEYYESFQVIDQLYSGKKCAYAQLSLSNLMEIDPFMLHPSLIDGILQAASGIQIEDGKTLYLPFSIGEIVLYEPLEKYINVGVSLIALGDDYCKYHFYICNQRDRIIGEIKEYTVKALRNS